MDIRAAANQIYLAIKDDATAVAAVRAEYASLSLAILTDPSASQTITSGTVNGQTFTATGGMTQAQRRALLRWVVFCLDNETTISQVAKPYF
jgi:hypothetical protein